MIIAAQDIARMIGEYYLHKNNLDYKQTGQEIL
jgi:hypothetical protein